MWTQSAHIGGRVHLQKQCAIWFVWAATLLQFRTLDVSVIKTTHLDLLVGKLAFKLVCTYLNIRHLVSHSTWWMRPSVPCCLPLFCLILCIIVNANERWKQCTSIGVYTYLAWYNFLAILSMMVSYFTTWCYNGVVFLQVSSSSWWWAGKVGRSSSGEASYSEPL